MLDKRKEDTIDMLILGSGPTEISKKVGVSRNAIYGWKEDTEFKEELEKRQKEIVNQANSYVVGKVESNLQQVQELALTSKDARTKASCLFYLIDKAIGKTPTRVTAVENNDNNIFVTLDNE